MKNLQNTMLKKGKKGFTLTELAIVIAVIAILIAVLVPTFTSIINNAKRTSAAETASHAITAYIGEQQTTPADDSIIAVEYDSSTTYYFTVKSGSITASEGTTSATYSSLYEYDWEESDNEDSFSTVTIYLSDATSMTNSVTNARTVAVAAVTAQSTNVTAPGYVNVGSYWWAITYDQSASVAETAETSAPGSTTINGYKLYTVDQDGVTVKIYVSNSSN